MKGPLGSALLLTVFFGMIQHGSSEARVFLVAQERSIRAVAYAGIGVVREGTAADSGPFTSDLHAVENIKPPGSILYNSAYTDASYSSVITGDSIAVDSAQRTYVFGDGGVRSEVHSVFAFRFLVNAPTKMDLAGDAEVIALGGAVGSTSGNVSMNLFTGRGEPVTTGEARCFSWTIVPRCSSAVQIGKSETLLNGEYVLEMRSTLISSNGSTLGLEEMSGTLRYRVLMRLESPIVGVRPMTWQTMKELYR